MMFIPVPEFDFSDAVGGLVWSAMMALIFPAVFGMMTKRPATVSAVGSERPRSLVKSSYIRDLLYWSSCSIPGWVLGQALLRGAKAEHHPELALTWLLAGCLLPTILLTLIIASVRPIHRFFFPSGAR
jgi:hypothetical protein